MITNALSVDVEEYYHAAIFRMGTGRARPSGLESRVERSVHRLLEVMASTESRATFFVLGEVASLHPAMVRAIAAAGHEIGCHGDRHDNVSGMGPSEFRADLRRARDRIQDVVGEPVIGYRAPNFSIGRTESWAYRILHEEGFLYDSSSYPIHHDRYGQPDAPRFPYEVWRDGAERLLEFPISTVRLLGLNLPIGGGGYFRLLPLAVTWTGIRRVNYTERRPVMFYLHPWELDPGQPRPAMPVHHRLRHYVGLEKEEAKLTALCDRVRFGTARDVLQVHRHLQPVWSLPVPGAAAQVAAVS